MAKHRADEDQSEPEADLADQDEGTFRGDLRD